MHTHTHIYIEREKNTHTRIYEIKLATRRLLFSLTTTPSCKWLLLLSLYCSILLLGGGITVFLINKNLVYPLVPHLMESLHVFSLNF